MSQQRVNETDSELTRRGEDRRLEAKAARRFAGELLSPEVYQTGHRWCLGSWVLMPVPPNSSARYIVAREESIAG